MRQNGSTEYERPAPIQQVCLGITDVAEEPKKGVEDLLNEVKAILTNGEVKQEFFNGLIAQNFIQGSSQLPQLGAYTYEQYTYLEVTTGLKFQSPYHHSEAWQKNYAY